MPPADSRTRLLRRAALACAILGFVLARQEDPQVVTRRGPLASAPELTGWTIEPRDADPVGTALLLHGVTASAETMRVLGESLARAGFRCLLLDVPGHGRSNGPVDWAVLRRSVAKAARELSGPGGTPGVDLIAGHSMGGYLARWALEERQVVARYFVSIGAHTAPGGLHGTPTLLITGDFDPLVLPAELEAVRADASPGQDVEVVGVPYCDHAAEPFHPLLIAGVLQRVRTRLGGAGDPNRGGGVWILRGLGVGLCLLAGLLALPLVVPQREDPVGSAEAVRLGLAGGATLLAGAALGIHGVVFYGLPGGKAWLGVPLLIGLAGIGSWGTHRLAGLIREGLAVAHVHLAGVLLLFLLGVGAGVGGLRFPGLLLVLAGCGAAIGAGLGAWLARRSGHPLTAHAAFAVCVGYLPGLWVRVFF